MEEVYRFSSGKNNWNTFRIGVDDGRIVVKDEAGHLEFEEDAVDELVNGIDQARRRLREKEREPTARRETVHTGEETEEPPEQDEEEVELEDDPGEEEPEERDA